METSTEIETKILNSFEQMIDNLTSEKDLDDQVNISNIQSAVDNILNEINGDPRNGFIKGNMISEEGNNSLGTGNTISKKDTLIANKSKTLQEQRNKGVDNGEISPDDRIFEKETFPGLLENGTLSKSALPENAVANEKLPLQTVLLLPNNTLQNEQFHIDLLPNESFPGTLKLNSHGKLDVINVLILGCFKM